MGIFLLLPIERLPAYVKGPMLVLAGAWLLMDSDDLSWWNWALCSGFILFGVEVVWHRYKTGKEC